MSSVDGLNAALDALDIEQQRLASSILLGYLWSAATPDVTEAALEAMRRHVK